MKNFMIVLMVFFPLSANVYAQSTLALQERCSKAAKEMFYEGYPSAITKDESLGKCVNSYENHYNKKLDKCFILSHSSCFTKDESSLFVSLWDVLEQKQYAGYCAFRDKEGFLTARICNLGQVQLNGLGEVLKVHGKHQDPVKQKFDDWIKPYMEK